MQLVTEMKYDIGVLGQFKGTFNRFSNHGGGHVVTEALKDEAATLMIYEKLGE